jgi:outer membrane protein assembly factor BamB
MIKPLSKIFCLVVLSVVTPSARAGDGWAQWGGPDRNFVVAEGRTPEAWGENGPKVLWKRELGPGYSAIVADQHRLFTMTRRGEKELVVALSRESGETLWEYAYASPVSVGTDLDTTYGWGPNGTPLLANGRIYAFGFTGILSCLDASTGKLVWAHDLGRDFDTPIPLFGHSTSPIRYKDLVIVIAGGAHAFRLDTGERAWVNEEFAGSYSSPVLSRRDGREQLIAPVAGEVVAVDPRDGRLVWRHEHSNQHQTFLSSPLLGEDGLLFASAYFLGSVGLRISADGRSVTELWENPKLQLAQTNAVRVGDIVYGFHNSILCALDVTTGEIIWRHRGYERANLIRAGERFLFFDRYGKLSLVSLDRKGPVTLAQTQVLEGRSWTVPTLINELLYARNLESIVALDLGRTTQVRTAKLPALIATKVEVTAPPEFIAAKKRLTAAYLASDTEGLASLRREFASWRKDEQLGHLAEYYMGFAAYQQALVSGRVEGAELLRESEARLRAAIERRRDFADAHALLARVYPAYWRFDRGRAVVAGPLGDEHMEAAWRLEPENPRVIAIRGLDYFYSPPEYGGDQNLGVVFLKRALEKFGDQARQDKANPDPDWGHASTWLWLGEVLERRVAGDRERVTQAFEAALELAPDFAAARQKLE